MLPISARGNVPGRCTDRAPRCAQAPPDAATHKAWMNEATDQQDELRDALAAKSTSTAATAAKELATLMGHTESYWDRKKATDVVLLARQARSLATETAAAASRSRFVEAKAAFDKLSATCNACHDLHPEKR
jgi:hypothetical protein